MSDFIKFGIDSLDNLFGPDTPAASSKPSSKGEPGIQIPPGDATSFCLIGPDGTGKSVFALHLANTHAVNQKQAPCTKVLYISTDLRFEMAETMAKDFGLDANLRHLKTADYRDLATYLLDKSSGIGFIDLASDSAGDDWALVARLLSLLEEPADGPKHLLVVDAVEGMETLAGETDAYGQKVSRRARIALLMRLASHKCHLVLVVEEPTEYTRLPEEFVVDTVLRLRSTLVNGYTRRTVEVEKARGQARGARGQHPFQIHPPKGEEKSKVQVFPSLHFQGNRLREETKCGKAAVPTDNLVGFGIDYLDSMLGHQPNGNPKFGLPAGRPFAVIGEAGTLKSALANAFLAQAVQDLTIRGSSDPKGIIVLCTSRPRSVKELSAALAQQLLGGGGRRSTEDVGQLQTKIESLESGVAPRIIVDQLAIHDQPGPRLVFRVKELIGRAKKSLAALDINDPHRIRVVFDDLTAFRNTYPDLRDDPLLLPLIIDITRHEGVSTLFVSTHAGKPGIVPELQFDAALRSLVDGHFLTWRVPFFGEMRTAVTFVPGFRPERAPAIREIVSEKTKSGDYTIDVDPEFELYDGLESDTPKPVPLEIRLYAETAAFVRYIEQEGKLIQHLFPGRGERQNADVITSVGRADYDSLRDYCYLTASTLLPQTLVLQVDEFWKSTREGMVANLQDHLDAPLAGEKLDQYEDHYGLFWQNTLPNLPTEAAAKRRDMFTVGCQESDRVPFTWDFGFLLLSHDDWHSALHEPLPVLTNTLSIGGKPNTITVGNVLGSLTKPAGSFGEHSDGKEPLDARLSPGGLLRGPSSWRAVLEASSAVARRRRARDSSAVNSFDLARPAGESFCSLVLEIWVSEIVEQYGALIRSNLKLDEKATKGAERFFGWIKDGKEPFSLLELVQEYELELYMTWMLLIESIDMKSFIDPDNRFAFAAEPTPIPAAAMRHWYKTACDAPSVHYSERPAIPVRLPGHFSVRGDWGLALAGGSRSVRLGTRALDFLSSRRANITRLQQGIGLPTRDIGHPNGLDQFRTRLSHINRENRRATINYADMIGLGADETLRAFRERCSSDSVFRGANEKPTSWKEMANGEFYWLRRSRIKNYARNSKIWQKWLLRVMLAMQNLVTEEAPRRQSGFAVYDKIAKSVATGEGIPQEIDELGTHKAFRQLVKFLSLELTWHTRISQTGPGELGTDGLFP